MNNIIICINNRFMSKNIHNFVSELKWLDLFHNFHLSCQVLI